MHMQECLIEPRYIAVGAGPGRLAIEALTVRGQLTFPLRLILSLDRGAFAKGGLLGLCTSIRETLDMRFGALLDACLMLARYWPALFVTYRPMRVSNCNVGICLDTMNVQRLVSVSHDSRFQSPLVPRVENSPGSGSSPKAG